MGSHHTNTKMRLITRRTTRTTFSFLLTSRCLFTKPLSSNALMFSTKGGAYDQKYGLPVTGLPSLPSGQSLQLKTMHGSGILGASIWPAAAPLCSYLAKNQHTLNLPHAHCIELGAGTGAVGLFAAGLGCPSVVLTDCRPPPDSAMYTTDGGAELPSDGSDTLLEILKHNVEENRELIALSNNNMPRVMELDWTQPDQMERVLAQSAGPTGTSTSSRGLFDLVLCSDVTHFSAMHQPLASNIAGLLNPDGGVCLVSHQERMITLNGHDMQLEDFISAARATCLDVERIEAGQPSPDGRHIAMLKLQHKGSGSDDGTGLVLR